MDGCLPVSWILVGISYPRILRYLSKKKTSRTCSSRAFSRSAGGSRRYSRCKLSDRHPAGIGFGHSFRTCIVLFFSLYQKLYSTIVNVEEMEKQRLLEYANRFNSSPREQEIFNLIVQGMSNTEIAGALFITESTVKFHAGNIFKKTGFSSRSALIADFKLRNSII